VPPLDEEAPARHLDTLSAALYKAARPDAQVAQSVEQRTENPRVGGSIPPLGTKLFQARSGT
jgi:hypothetical protein